MTLSGKRFYLECPLAAEVALEDVAHTLSLRCRHYGHGRKLYTLAQHATLVAGLILAETGDPEDALAGLHYFDSRAYLDLPEEIFHAERGRLKRLAVSYRRLSAKIDRAIRERFGIVHNAYIVGLCESKSRIAHAVAARTNINCPYLYPKLLGMGDEMARSGLASDFWSSDVAEQKFVDCHRSLNRNTDRRCAE